MASIYTMICRECGRKFDVLKGILMSETGLDPIPEEQQMETPFSCSDCGHIMSTEDKDFKQHIETIIMAD